MKGVLSNGSTPLESVEVERFELSSKQGNNELSTCLSPLQLSDVRKTGATNAHLSLLIFTVAPRPDFRYFRYSCTTCSERFGTTATG